MDEAIVRKIEVLERQIEQAKACDDDLKLCREIMPSDATLWIDHEVNVVWHTDSMDDVKAVLRSFAQRGIMLDHVSKTDKPEWQLKGMNVGIRLVPDWSIQDEKEEKSEGKSCRLVKVDEKTYTYPVYKLVCDDKEAVNEEG
jgi:hypothetical protein